MGTKINISFVIYAGLSYGGSHKQSLSLAKILDKNIFTVRYFWCRHHQDRYSDFLFPDISLELEDDLRNHGVEPIEFQVGYRDISHPYHPWYQTDFFEVFNKYPTDLIFTVKSGTPEYPFVHLNIPVIECNIFCGVDRSPNLVYSVGLSPWVYKQYLAKGGFPEKSYYCFYGMKLERSKDDFRMQLDIPKDAIVLGFHQRDDIYIYTRQALQAWAFVRAKTNKKLFFVILGGSKKYVQLAKELQLPVRHLPITFDPQVVSKFLNTLDVFTHSAGQGETLGIAVQEAMFHGLPIVAMYGQNNGHVDVIGETMPVAKNQDEYNQLLLDLIVNDEKRKHVGDASLARANKYFGLDYMKEYYEKLFIEKYTEYCLNKKIDFHPEPLTIYSKFSLYVIAYRLLYRLPWVFKIILVVYYAFRKLQYRFKKVS
jgi:glycosyltransferase involved in cell wall biosynthesis